jgi:hypothetical protein
MKTDSGSYTGTVLRDSEQSIAVHSYWIWIDRKWAEKTPH